MRIRRLIYHMLWLGALYGGRSPELQGQSPFNPAFRSEAIKISEHLNLFTDRSIYAVGESLQFRADQTVSAVEAQEWSSVLYLELVTASGNAVAQGKFILKNGMSKGSLQIPSWTLTGLYYLSEVAL